MITCEVCVEGIQGALAAEAGGAGRIELCAGLVEGGTTPSIGTIRQVLESVGIPVVVLVRPRGGDFLFSDREIDTMLRDIEAVRDAGAFGIAVGALTDQGDVDRQAMREIIDAAGGLSVTFHRAFDMSRDPLESLEMLVQLGVDRILTSGQERTVPEGLALIRDLVRVSGNRISIMPGGGVRDTNIRDIVLESGVREVHFTAFSTSPSAMVHRNHRPRMGAEVVVGEYERETTDPEQVRRFLRALHKGD